MATGSGTIGEANGGPGVATGADEVGGTIGEARGSPGVATGTDEAGGTIGEASGSPGAATGAAGGVGKALARPFLFAPCRVHP